MRDIFLLEVPVVTIEVTLMVVGTSLDSELEEQAGTACNVNAASSL